MAKGNQVHTPRHGKEPRLETTPVTHETPITPAASRTPLSVGMRILHLAAFTIFSLLIPVVLGVVALAGNDPAAQSPVATLPFLVIVLAVIFSLIACRRPVYLIGFVLCTLLGAGLGRGLGACTASLICATVAGTALFTDQKPSRTWPFGFGALAAYLISLVLSQSLLFSLMALLPLCGAVALAFCLRKRYSLIVSSGALTGTLAAALVLLTLIFAAASGMPLTADGIRGAINDFRDMLAQTFSQAIDMMMEMPEMKTQFTAIFGESLTPEELAEIAKSYGATALNLLPGMVGMALWCLSFVTLKGAIATLFAKTPRAKYPAYAARFTPSLPTAVLYLLCFFGAIGTALVPQLEMVSFVLLNVFLILMPMMTVLGILDVLASFRRPHFRFGSIALYVIMVIFLGIWVLPLISVTGAFSVISRALVKVLEKQLNNYRKDE